MKKLLLASVLSLSALVYGDFTFQAEDVVVEKEKILHAKGVRPKGYIGWDFWDTDTKGTWNKDTVLRSDIIRADRDPHSPEASMLTLRLPVPEPGKYVLFIRGGRTFGVSTDGGKTFTRINAVGFWNGVEPVDGIIELKVANCYAYDADPAGCGWSYIDYINVKKMEAGQAGFSFQSEPDVVYDDVDDASWIKVPFGELIKGQNPKDLKGKTIKVSVLPPGGGTYNVYLKCKRYIGISLDGKKFDKFRGTYRIGDVRKASEGPVDVWLADKYGNAALEHVEGAMFQEISTGKSTKFEGFSKTTVKENLSRGAVAIQCEDGAYISWRLLKEDAAGIGFNVFKEAGGKKVLLNKSPLVQTTDFVDGSWKKGDKYIIEAVPAGAGKPGKAVWWETDGKGKAFRRFVLPDKADMAFNHVGICDLNGDGDYDFVFKTPSTNVDPASSFWYKSEKPYSLEAFLSDGTHLWSKSMGWAIETGVWYSPYLVYDLNGDGKAEVAMKQGVGDPRTPTGHVVDGEEFLVVFDGMTGKEISRVPWPSRAGFERYNYASRNQITMAYLDGKTPCVVALRGTYKLMKAEAWQLKDGKLEEVWKFNNLGMAQKYWGQGAHSTIVADLDGDGRDEILLGSMALDDDGTILWSTGLGHPDVMHLSDHDPDNPGMEVSYCVETGQPANGVCLVDGKTGKILWGLNEKTTHVGGGASADFDPAYPGIEHCAVEMHGRISFCRWYFTCKGDVIVKDNVPIRRSIYWDADLEKECFGSEISDYFGMSVDKSFEGRTVAIADVIGDWREEAITTLPGEVRIYTTSIPAFDRRPALMQEHSYRTSVLNGSQGYYHVPDLPYTPTIESDNFSLIMRSGERCQMTVSASKYAPLKGRVTFEIPEGIEFTPSSLDVDLKPGEIKVTNLVIGGKTDVPRKMPAMLTKADGTVLGNMVSIPRIFKASIPANAIVIPSKSRIYEEGGKVMIAEGRPISKDGCLAGWDKAGHKLAWNFTVPKDGKYRIGWVFACPKDAPRKTSIGGQELGDVLFKVTGGFGKASSEWGQMESKVVTLKAGVNRLDMNNAAGISLNLAYLYLVPVP